MAQLKRKKLVVYPFAHLSSDLAEPKSAMALINYMAERAASENIEVRKAPFGWNKKLDLNIKTADDITKKSNRPKGLVTNSLVTLVQKGIIKRVAREKAAGYYVIKA